MLRYCTKCCKEYDFDPLVVASTASLQCPGCGKVIGKDSRRPIDRRETLKMEENIGRGFYWLFRLSYIFYLLISTIGIVCFSFKFDKALFIITAFILGVFILQHISGYHTFKKGFIFLPMGAVAGFLIFKSVQGACFGVHIVFFLRHLIRDIFYALIWKLVKLGNMK